jgi:ppGpp synthetase/RelA/SpoT-type nucleotidyltranferase
MDGHMAGPRSDLAGVRVSVAFVFVGNFESVDRLVRELESRRDPKLVYTKTSVQRLKVVLDDSPETRS